MPKLTRPLPIGPGGVAAELGVVGPTRPRPPASGPPSAPPEQPESGPEPEPKAPEQPEDQSLRQMMAIRPLPGRRGRRTGRIRWYHRVRRDGIERMCWAFSIPRANHEAWVTGEPLSARGAVYPDGAAVVPKGTDPSACAIRCGSCSTQTVDFLQLAFYEE